MIEERNKKNPYYIVAPNYTCASAGIFILHLLCHYLNLKGERAYLIIFPFKKKTPINPLLYTPMLTQDIIDDDFKKGLCPITIYPEVIEDNFYQAPFVVRYLLNFPNLMAQYKDFTSDDFILSYSKKIADSFKKNNFTLFIPISDPELFKPIENTQRKGSCFYADKYQRIHRQKLLPITNNSFEITRFKKDSPSQKEIAQLLASSEVFYCYENTSLIIEALLSGCPVVLVKNPFFSDTLASHEYGTYGIAKDETPKAIEDAKKTILLAREKYMDVFNEVSEKIDSFIQVTQKEVKNKSYYTPMRLSLAPHGKRRILHVFQTLFQYQGIFYNICESKAWSYLTKKIFVKIFR